MSVSVSRTGDSELMNPPVIGAASASSRPSDGDTHHFSAAPDLGHHPWRGDFRRISLRSGEPRDRGSPPNGRLRRRRLRGRLGDTLGTRLPAQLSDVGTMFRLARGLSPSSYQRKWLAKDVVAGVVVSTLLVPQ